MEKKNAVIECIPNFSEGRRKDVIEKIADVFRAQNGCKLADVKPDEDHNRTVYTIIGQVESVKAAIIKAIGVAVETINMEEHKGEHPRIGACDVVPFVPISNCSIEDCVEISKSVAEEINKKYNIPIYLYEESACKPERRNLADIRKGEYEGLKNEIKNSERYPDIGEPKFHPTAGATVVGARKPLIAYNINLNTSDLKIAKEIAKRIRARTGGLTYVKALGVMIKEKNCAQVTMNLTDFTKSAIYTVFEMVKMEAKRFGIVPTDSEIVGLVPMDALIEAAKYYLQIGGLSESQILERHLMS